MVRYLSSAFSCAEHFVTFDPLVWAGCKVVSRVEAFVSFFRPDRAVAAGANGLAGTEAATGVGPFGDTVRDVYGWGR